MKQYYAKISWISYEQGGRKDIPVSHYYAPQINIFPPYLIQKQCWSIFVFNETIINEHESIALINYLSEDAPDDLDKDVKFSLYEGSKLVAKGIVLSQIEPE